MKIDQTMPINYVRLIARELRLKEQGLDDLLEDTALTREQLHGGAAILTVTEQFTVLRNAMRISKDVALGFRLGKLLHISTHGNLGIAAFTSANLKDAISALCSYMRIRAPFLYIDPEPIGSQLALIVRSSVEIDSGIRHVAMECICLLIQQLIEFVITRDLIEADIRVDYERPAYIESYIKAFHSPVKFNCERVEFRIPLSLLDTPCPTADLDAYNRAIKLCHQILSKLEGEDSTTSQVKRILLSNSPESISQEIIAQQLCITPRTLIRRLKKEQSNYREIQENVLTQMAESYLHEKTLSVEVIAEILGYSDTANFRRAFKRWTGKTPQQYRNILVAGYSNK